MVVLYSGEERRLWLFGKKEENKQKGNLKVVRLR